VLFEDDVFSPKNLSVLMRKKIYFF